MKFLDDIVVFSHLRWDFVYQRPQHLLSRLKRGRRVVFIEEPHPEPQPEAGFGISEADENLLVCTPVLPRCSSQFRETLLKHAVDELLQKIRPRKYVLWFYTPMALPLAAGLKPELIVYDCMDELSAFKNAPQDLLQREQELLSQADLVFTGGQSLFRAKRGLHPDVHCFPSSVDRTHFAKALNPIEHPLQAGIPHPRLGYFGVIDERMDLDLLRVLAQSRPEWHIVMVGPVAKIDPADLPQAANLHYLGSQPYQLLPALLSSWDVCLMPFAINQATRFISPTKVLEYMAAEKMIVSTAIADVVEPYGEIVWIARNHDEFIEACEQALTLDLGAQAVRRAGMNQVLNRTSWDDTAARMETLMEAAVNRKHSGRNSNTVGTLIVGAGPTGLSAAYHLQNDYALLERNDTVGGWCRSIEKDGFIFDYVGHIMFSSEPYVHRMYKILLGDNVHWQDREAWIYSKNVYTRYPFQQSLYGLPPDVIRECLIGAIEARFGPINEPSHNGHTNGHHRIEDCCGDGILEATAPFASRQCEPPQSFEQFIYRVWGEGIAKHFAIPYNRKLWAVPLNDMETSWLGGRVPLPDLNEMIEGAISPARKPVGPNARFGYPLRGGFQALMSAFLPHLRGYLHLEADVVSISPSNRTARLADGRAFRYEQLISTMPLPRLIDSIGAEAPVAIRNAASGLRYTSVRGVHIGVGRPQITEKHWIYYPEDTVFHRIFVQGNASPFCNPTGGFGVTFEITYGPSKPLPCDGAELVELCIRDARRVGFIREDDPIWTSAMVDLPFAYVIYDHGRAERVQLIREWLKDHRILVAGRYGEWEYYNSDHAFIAGKKAAEAARDLSAGSIVQPDPFDTDEANARRDASPQRA